MSTISDSNRSAVIADLRSKDPILVARGIETLKKEGDVTFVPEILSVLARTQDAFIEADLAQLLFDLKDQKAVEALVDRLTDPEFSSIRVQMLSACWQTGFDLAHRLPEFITVASTGNYMECLEVLTIIENWESIPDQEMLENELIRMRSYLAESDTPENDEMIFSIIEVMENFVVQ